ncbi:MAG TPA: hypothetical protein VFA20_23245 [Myxococcaceae bacterium]|nr:hypothetical protein [Myxococcaceae bacterium]
MRAFAVAAVLSLFLVPGGAFAGSVKVSSHKGKTTVRVHSKGKPAKIKIKS